MIYGGAQAAEHRTLAIHLTAETQVEKTVPGVGIVRVWEKTPGRHANHYLDAAALSCGAAVWRGLRIPDSAAPPARGDRRQPVSLSELKRRR